jgi:hypothetical protein
MDKENLESLSGLVEMLINAMSEVWHTRLKIDLTQGSL